MSYVFGAAVIAIVLAVVALLLVFGATTLWSRWRRR